MIIFNTLSRNLEEFKSIKNKQVLFYQCGPTVYWRQHIGNLRAVVMADLIIRSLHYLGYQVNFIRNYTDVGHLTSDEDIGEDKMEKGAKREGLSPKEIAEKYIKIFENDTGSLNIIEPDVKPRASEYIKPIIEMIAILLKKGYAYKTELGIVYDVSKFPDYNKLNRQKIVFNKKGAGKGTVDDPQKKHYADFNLWVFKKGSHVNALQTWLSPWGEGFPGWHIECSVMAKVLLGETLDIHMGGIEHIPVHHTNEIAQSEAANSKTFVHYWLHNEHLTVNGAKMAKSEGRGLSLEEVINKNYDPLVLRYFYLSAHYRSKQNFTWEALKNAQETLKKLRNTVIALSNKSYESNKTDKSNQTHSGDADAYKKRFIKAIQNDFQIPQALAISWEMLKSNLSNNEKLKLLFDFDKVFGLRLNEISEEKIPDVVIQLAEERKLAREKKDFSKSDELRKKINFLGFNVEDLKGNNYKLKILD